MPVQVIQRENLIKISDNGFDFFYDQETLTIVPSITVESLFADGVASSKAGSVLSNRGLVFGYGSGFDGVDFTGSNARVANLAGGLIYGDSTGVSLAGGGSQVVNNDDTILGGGVGVSFAGGNNIFLKNHGYIHGGNTGIGITSTLTGGTIKNFGVVGGGSTAFFVKTADDLTTFISNAATGTIAAINAIFMKTGMLSLNNAGKIDGAIGGAIGHDSIVNSGKILGDVYLGGGDDLYRGVGQGKVPAGVHGQAGNDRFVADQAKETFFGEADADTFVFASVLFSPANAKRDTIGGFSESDLDKINVHAIDANTMHAGNQNFVFIGTDSFAHFHSVHPGVVGMLRFAAASQRVQGNVNGDFAHADLEVNLPGVTSLHASDFVL